MSGIREAVAAAAVIYEIPDDDLVGEVLIPALAAASFVSLGAGYFSSVSLAQLAPGLAAFLRNTKEPLRILLSPDLSEDDRTSIARGVEVRQEVLEEIAVRLLQGVELSSSSIVEHTLDCLTYLVANNRLEFRFALMPNGMYHKKLWIIGDGRDWMAVHGSGNATGRGLLVNGEQMTIDRPWRDGPASVERVERLRIKFQLQWENRDPRCLAVDVTQALRHILGQRKVSRTPTIDDFWASWRVDQLAGLEPSLPPGLKPSVDVVGAGRPRLRPPEDMNWRDGRFGHQGRAVDALMEANYRGVIAIATGGGKTKTALLAASQVQEAHHGPTLVVVTVPTKPLVKQWTDEVTDFGIRATVLAGMTPLKRRAELSELDVALRTDGRRTDVIICSNGLLNDDPLFRSFLDSLPESVRTMLIADEVHNLGTPGFLYNKPDRFDHRVGLSATPERQYDPEGTEQLFEYFGAQVFEFSLKEAIDSGCLVRYRYHLHIVDLDTDEFDEYDRLTQQLRKVGFVKDDVGQTVGIDSQVEALLRKRRAIVEQARAKLLALRRALLSTPASEVRRTLIYASAKPQIIDQERQLLEVNRLLAELGIISHQFTFLETRSPSARKLLDAFRDGQYQVLTAMKVLDEGIDLPQTDTAYLLASSTVRREWVQRRGRILRQAPGKEIADLHDFLVRSPNSGSPAARSLAKGELARAEAFVEVAENAWDPGGPWTVIKEYEADTQEESRWL